MDIYLHQRANGLNRQADFSHAKITDRTFQIPFEGPETSLHLRLYLTRANLDSPDHSVRIVTDLLDGLSHRPIDLMIIPQNYGNEKITDHSPLIRDLRGINRLDRIGIAFSETSDLLDDKTDIDFYGIKYEFIRGCPDNERVIQELRKTDQVVYAVPTKICQNSRYLNSLEPSYTVLEYSSQEEWRMIVNDHGFIYRKNN